MLKRLSALAMTVLFVLTGQICARAAAPAPVTINTPVKDKWALVVGISKFANSSLNLKYAAKDAQDFRDFLIGKCNFAADHVKLLQNEQATKDRILDILGDSWLPRVSLPDDLVVIFISSHGSPSDLDVAGVNYVVAHDTNPDKLFTTGIPIQHLASTIKSRVHSNRVLVILDACHSGGAGESKGLVRTSNVDASAIAQGTGHMVICSSAKSEASWESKKYPNGVFTHTLIEALQSKGASTKLTDAFGMLKTGVQQQVAAERGVMQTPVLEMSKWKGDDILLAVKPTEPRKSLVEIDDPKPVAQTAPNLQAQPPQVQTSPPVQVAALPSTVADMRIPDVSGAWIGSNGINFVYWQNGRSIGWDMYGVSLRGTISEDGKSQISQWTGTLTGSGSATIEADERGKAIRMVGNDGVILTRPEALAMANSMMQQAQKGVAANIPTVEGTWLGANGVKYQIWQSGYNFGWKLPRFNEVGIGIINQDLRTGTCSWTGPYASSCTFAFELDSTGRAIRMRTNTGATMTRL
ncbi:MAG: caspase family protein [Candidatus Melainabacteria bacterium]|nr:caspase family protein [Candidatus Melainabacteria bacterium]